MVARLNYTKEYEIKNRKESIGKYKLSSMRKEKGQVKTVNFIGVGDKSGTFTSAALDTDDTFSHTYSAPGEYPYICTIHPYMVGKIIVKPRREIIVGRATVTAHRFRHTLGTQLAEREYQPG